MGRYSRLFPSSWLPANPEQARACPKAEPIEKTLPVYEVTQAGVAGSQAKSLADALHIPAEKLVVKDAVASLVDTDNYLAVPTVAVNDSAVIEKLRGSTVKNRPQTNLRVDAIDLAALEKLPVLDADSALSRTSAAFASAGLHLQASKAVVGHTTFTVWFTKGGAGKAPVSHQLAPRVDYELFEDQHGFPLIGPGAQVEVRTLQKIFSGFPARRRTPNFNLQLA